MIINLSTLPKPGLETLDPRRFGSGPDPDLSAAVNLQEAVERKLSEAGKKDQDEARLAWKTRELEVLTQIKTAVKEDGSVRTMSKLAFTCAVIGTGLLFVCPLIGVIILAYAFFVQVGHQLSREENFLQNALALRDAHRAWRTNPDNPLSFTTVKDWVRGHGIRIHGCGLDRHIKLSRPLYPQLETTTASLNS